MAKEINNRLIGQVVREKGNPVAIRRAFNRGCAGVLVKLSVPDNVTREIQMADFNGLINIPDKILTLEYGEANDRYGVWTKDYPFLNETKRWLRDRRAWAEATGLQKQFSQAARDLTVWMNQGLDYPWHIDNKQEEAEAPDVHFHVYGKNSGIYIASSSKPRIKPFLAEDRDVENMRVRKNNPAYYDDVLRNEGIEVLQMQEGEVLFFNDRCLHRSSAATGKKLRAAIF